MAESLATLSSLDLGAPPLPTVQLRHVLADGSSHIDWMIARDSHGERPLMTFRLDRPIHRIAAETEILMTRLPDHRSRYLDYEGSLSDGRGHVKRIARGSVVGVKPAESAQKEGVELTIDWTELESANGEPSMTRTIVRIRSAQADDRRLAVVSNVSRPLKELSGQSLASSASMKE